MNLTIAHLFYVTVCILASLGLVAFVIVITQNIISNNLTSHHQNITMYCKIYNKSHIKWQYVIDINEVYIKMKLYASLIILLYIYIIFSYILVILTNDYRFFSIILLFNLNPLSA